MAKEAKARILINDLLRRSGWRFFEDERGPANIALETHVKLKKKTVEDLGDDFEKTTKGYVDYLLLDARGFPVAVLEPSSRRLNPSDLSTPSDPTPTHWSVRRPIRELIQRFEAKIKTKLNEIWGEHGSAMEGTYRTKAIPM